MTRLWSRCLASAHRLALLAAVLPGALCAQSLVERSPFLPPDFQPPGSRSDAEAAAPPPTASHLQLKGVFAIDGQTRVNIFNTRTNEGKWVATGGEVEGFRVVSYDPDERSVDLEVNGQIETFALAKPSDTPMAVAGAVPAQVAAAQPNVQPVNRRVVRPSTTTNRRRTIVPPRPNRQIDSSGTPGGPPRTINRPVTRPVVPPSTPNGAGANLQNRPQLPADHTNRPAYVNPRVVRPAGS